MLDLAALTRTDLRSFFERLGEKSFRGDQVFGWIWGRGARSFDEMTDLPAAVRARLNETATLGLPVVSSVAVSSDGTRKLVVRLVDGKEVEAVIIPDGERVTLCISSQVGCALACAFCATGKMGLTRHLTPGEIAGQVMIASNLLREDPGDIPIRAERPITNIVYMGMGEPLHNWQGTRGSIEILIDPKGFDYAPRRITVSTVGMVPKMLELGELFPVVLAVSLHAADDELRGSIMPINKKYNLEAVIAACREFPLRARERITFEYVMLAGVNDRREDADRLIRLLRGLECKVNLIPFNEHEGAPFRRPSISEVKRFEDHVRNAGVQAFVRRTRGRDIAAACGQLALTQARADAPRPTGGDEPSQ